MKLYEEHEGDTSWAMDLADDNLDDWQRLRRAIVDVARHIAAGSQHALGPDDWFEDILAGMGPTRAKQFVDAVRDASAAMATLQDFDWSGFDPGPKWDKEYVR